MSTQTLRSGAAEHPEDAVLQLHTDLVVAGGVLDLLAGGLVVSEKAAGADMSVDIAPGRMYLKKTANAYPGINYTTANIAVGSNSSGNPRVDAVVAYLDLAEDPSINDDGTGIIKFAIVAGTPGASPVIPDATAIGTAIGASNPYEIIASILVPNGTSDIEDGDITDRRRRVFMRTPTPIYPLPYAATIVPNYANGSQQIVSLTGDVIVDEPTNMQIGDVMIIDFVQDATGGRTATFDFTTRATGGEDPELDSTPSTITTVGIRRVSLTTYHVQYVDVGAS